MAGGVPPVYVLELVGELRGGFEQFGPLDEASLHTQFHILLDKAFHRLHHQRGTQRHQLVVQVSGRIRRLDVALGTKDDAAGIYLVVYHEGSDTGDVLSVDHGPVDGGGAAVLRQQGGVQVEGAQPGHRPHYLRKHPEAHYHKQIGLEGGQILQELLVLEFLRLQKRQALLHGDGALVHLEAAAAGLVWYGNNAHHLVAGLDKGIQRAHRELRRAHIDNAGFSEHTNDLTLDFAVAGPYQVYVEQAGVLDGFRRQENPDGGQHEGRYELADKGRRGAVVGQALTGDVHHPVQYEKEHGDDGRGTHTAFLEEGADGRSDEKQ